MIIITYTKRNEINGDNVNCVWEYFEKFLFRIINSGMAFNNRCVYNQILFIARPFSAWSSVNFIQKDIG